MGDLISRKALLDTERLLMTDLVENNPTAKYILEQVLYDIEHAPTAFNREKVMSEMRKKYEDAARLYGRDIKTAHNYSSWARKDAWEKAIEIVEKGGIE